MAEGREGSHAINGSRPCRRHSTARIRQPRDASTGPGRIISGAGGGSQTSKQQDLTATVILHAGGQVLVGIVGLVIVIPAWCWWARASAASS